MYRAIEQAIPTKTNRISPIRVDKIYKLEGSEASLDFQLSVTYQKKSGRIVITSPNMTNMMIKKITYFIT